MEVTTCLSKLLQDFKCEEGYYTGYLEGDDQFTAFLDTLFSLGFTFATRNSRLNLEHKDKTKFFYSHENGEIRIKFCGCPFHLTQVIDLECSLGPNYRAIKTTSTPIQQEVADHLNITRRIQKQPSRRIGCPGKFMVKGVRMYPEYSVDSPKKNNRHHRKVMARLKTDFKNPELSLTAVDRYYIKLSTETCHSHQIISNNRCQTIHPRLKQKILDLVDHNVCSAKIIKLHLDELVREMFKDPSLPPPDPLNRCFYPTVKTIYNLVYSTISQSKKSTLDKGAMEKRMKTWAEVPAEQDGSGSPVVMCQEEQNEPITIPNLLSDSAEGAFTEDNLLLHTSQSELREELQTLMDLTYTATDMEKISLVRQQVMSLIPILTEASPNVILLWNAEDPLPEVQG